MPCHATAQDGNDIEDGPMRKRGTPLQLRFARGPHLPLAQGTGLNWLEAHGCRPSHTLFRCAP